MSNNLWEQLFSISETLNESAESKEEKLKILIKHLASINITHERSFDPAENFEAYVAVDLCEAIHKVLKQN
ncbi:hypothetical protein A3Q34_17690 [Colwellia sp. PAMC 20917]|uniref:hypothetical protein n=1 Tax=Colwellia sp. PAMC 20917 TaxID=1816218 RepID=UPI000878BD30|nr:hypothetical protein [Colwellia sp. PAMC 20917]AOW78513.1 hypothetical protein A3Q34_17690 [Colwellia sp. PAMC 20917]